jgi:hypothetical protein
MTDFAPSEEFALFCDVPGCSGALSMVAGVSRDQHGWGRITVYDDADYDLCPEHYRQIREVLGNG